MHKIIVLNIMNDNENNKTVNGWEKNRKNKSKILHREFR